MSAKPARDRIAALFAALATEDALPLWVAEEEGLFDEANLDVQISAGTSKPLTWREVLDLQAAFELLGCREPAVGLAPENWHVRYRNWRHVRGAEPPHVERPEEPFRGRR